MQEKTTGALEQELSACAAFHDFVRDHPDLDLLRRYAVFVNTNRLQNGMYVLCVDTRRTR